MKTIDIKSIVVFKDGTIGAIFKENGKIDMKPIKSNIGWDEEELLDFLNYYEEDEIHFNDEPYPWELEDE